MARRTAPPDGLKNRGRDLWAACIKRDPALADSDNPQRPVLHEAARLADQLDVLAARLAADGPIISDSKGTPAPHPALKAAHQGQALLARLLASLRMPDASSKRPQRRGSPRLQTIARKPPTASVSSLERARLAAEASSLNQEGQAQ